MRHKLYEVTQQITTMRYDRWSQTLHLQITKN